jgi:replicative DNA helicase
MNNEKLTIETPTPQLSEFSEADAIAWAADGVWILRRIDDKQQDLAIQRTDAFLLKHRDGRTGKIPMRFHATFRQFEEIPEPQHEREVA